MSAGAPACMDSPGAVVWGVHGRRLVQYLCCREAYPRGGLIGPPGAGLNLTRVKGGEGIIWDDPHGAA